MDEETIKKTIEDFQKATASLVEIRGRLDTVEEKTGHIPSDLKEIREKVNTEFAETYVSKQDAEVLLARLDEVDKRFELLKEVQADSKVEGKAHRAAWLDYIRRAGGARPVDLGELKPETREFMASDEYARYVRGISEDDPIEVRALTEGTADAGGLFVSPEVEKEILKNVLDIDPVRSYASVRSIASNEVKGFRLTTRPTAYHDTELGTGTETQAVWTDWKIGAHPLTAKFKASSDVLDDVGFIESEMIGYCSDAFLYTEGVDFVEGNGVDRAMGFTTLVGTDDAKYPAAVTGTGTNVIATGDIPKMWGTLKAAYRGNAHWTFNSDSFIKLLSLKDANNRYYMVADGGLVAAPATRLYGLPFFICESLSDEGSDTYPLWIGDFRQGYKIVDRSGIQLMVDPYTAWPAIWYKMRKRVGGQVVKAEAIKGLLTT